MDTALILNFLQTPWVFLLWTTILKSSLLLGIVLGLVSYTVYAERRVSALIQDRVGPNRVGIPMTLLGGKRDIFFFGLGQPIVDALKLLLKENFVPSSVNGFYYWLAPKLVMVPPILVLGVLPFGSSLFGVQMTIADLNIGVLYIFAISSLSVYGITLAGWVVFLMFAQGTIQADLASDAPPSQGLGEGGDGGVSEASTSGGAAAPATEERDTAGLLG